MEPIFNRNAGFHLQHPLDNRISTDQEGSSRFTGTQGQHDISDENNRCVCYQRIKAGVFKFFGQSQV